MTDKSFISDRYFIMYDFRFSHGQLVLRSQKNEKYKYNIDIIFYDATFIQTFSMLHGIKIYKNKAALTNISYPTVHEYLSYDNKNLFLLESNGEIYYIAASFFLAFENQLEFNESSLYFDRGVQIGASL